LWLSFRLSHFSTWFARRLWVSTELSARPCIARTIWTPATAHHSFVACDANILAGFVRILKSTGLRGGFGDGVGRFVPDPSAGGSVSTGSSVISIVGAMSRSGGGSIARRTRSTRWSKRSPRPNAFVQMAPVVTTSPSASTSSTTASGVRLRRLGGWYP
jgi:hypothetical protein